MIAASGLPGTAPQNLREQMFFFLLVTIGQLDVRPEVTTQVGLFSKSTFGRAEAGAPC